MLAAVAHGHHGHFALVLLVLLVVVGVVFLLVRVSGRRNAGNRDARAGRVWGQRDAYSTPSRALPTKGETVSASPAGGLPPPALLRGDERGTPFPDDGDFTGREGEGAIAVPAAVHPVVPPPPSHDGGWAVETHGLTKRFGSNIAVNNVELLVPRGCAFGYLGPNGAGKTTLIRTLLGLTKADGGTMSLLGIPVPRERSRALARVGAIVDEPRFHEHLTGRENLRLLAAARGADTGERVGPELERVGLTARADDRVASYSMGMRQRLGVAACLLADPELLILDEPMNGLDPAGMHAMRSMIQGLVGEGRTVMLSSHLLDEVERTCDTVAIVDRGHVVRQGPIEELIHGTANVVLQVDCGDAASAARLITEAKIAIDVVVGEEGLMVTLPPGADRERIAEINRRLVESGISVYSFHIVRTTLEDWFLSVTSRFGEDR
jgi:ABC-2 type transport system ATP-binding protein